MRQLCRLIFIATIVPPDSMYVSFVQGATDEVVHGAGDGAVHGVGVGSKHSIDIKVYNFVVCFRYSKI